MADKVGPKSTKKKKKKSRLRKVITLSVSIVLGTFLIAVLIVFGSLWYFVSQTNRQELDFEGYTVLEETESAIEDVTPEVPEETSADTSIEELNEYQLEAQKALAELGFEDEKLDDVYNVLLVGSDTRESGGTGRSDTMMLVSINSNTKKIVATSFLRDLYVYIPQKEYYDKINAAYAYGGMELLIETLQYNFSIQVDKYITVDFYSFMEAIDTMGGIDVDVQEEELYWCNQYIHASNLLLGCDEFSDYLTYADGSFQHLSGKQALAYARFRYVGNGDFDRTERQRKVVNIIFDQLKTINVITLIDLVETFMKEITTNIPEQEFIELIALIPDMNNYDIVSWGIPDEDFKYLTIDGISSIGIDFSFYVNKLYNLIYTDAMNDIED